MTIRTAVITNRRDSHFDSLEAIQRYLPSNYSAVENADGTVTITGTDSAGWTLEGYVIPRLASGLIYAKEVLDPALTVAALDALHSVASALLRAKGDFQSRSKGEESIARATTEVYSLWVAWKDSTPTREDATEAVTSLLKADSLVIDALCVTSNRKSVKSATYVLVASAKAREALAALRRS